MQPHQSREPMCHSILYIINISIMAEGFHISLTAMFIKCSSRSMNHLQLPLYRHPVTHVWNISVVQRVKSLINIAVKDFWNPSAIIDMFIMYSMLWHMECLDWCGCVPRHVLQHIKQVTYWPTLPCLDMCATCLYGHGAMYRLWIMLMNLSEL